MAAISTKTPIIASKIMSTWFVDSPDFLFTQSAVVFSPYILQILVLTVYESTSIIFLLMSTAGWESICSRMYSCLSSNK